MDFNRQNINSNGASTGLPVNNQPGQPSQTKHSKKLGGGKLNIANNQVGWGLLLVSVVLVVFGLLWLFNVNRSNEYSQVNTKEYQAVFLSNGQVYFGKLVSINNSYVKLDNIFYLQAKQSVQPKQQDQASTNNNDVQLVKLGNELHGPEDAMVINRTEILFWENLKSSGKVTQAIDNYNKTGASADVSSNGSAPVTQPTTQGTTGTNGTSGTPAGTTGTGTTPPPAQ